MDIVFLSKNQKRELHEKKIFEWVLILKYLIHTSSTCKKEDLVTFKSGSKMVDITIQMSG